MKKINLSKVILLSLLTMTLLMPAIDAQAADRAKYKNCIQSCQAQYASCYKNTKNRAQCREQQAACSQGCASYLSSLKQRILALVYKKEEE